MGEQKLVDALRILCIDQVQAAGSGHPGGPMGMADIAYVLWRKHLSFCPANPDWANRDRVILSNGHCSALQYALLHLCGYGLGLDELRNFRQLHSRTAGHPERGLTPGVEATTGPLGQGLANGVGMALAAKRLAAEFNTPGFAVIDHRIYVLAGDGCMMEGISYEAMSLAGQWGLDNLIVIYDQNRISIDGDTAGWFRENVGERAQACGWHTLDGIDGHDRGAIDEALAKAKAASGRPSLLLCQTEIGHGSPGKAGSADCHGAPLGADEVTATRQAIAWEDPEPFAIPEAIYRAWDSRDIGQERLADWQARWQGYRQGHPEQAAGLAERLGLDEGSGLAASEAAQRRWRERVDEAESQLINGIDRQSKASTRQISGQCLERMTELFPEIIGGSADLSGSNCVINARTQAITAAERLGNFLHYGAREFAMVAVNNGLALYGGLVPYSASFLVFTDYARNAIRMASLMKARHVLVMTHDSIALGEDGPTHQPIEHLESLRLIPGLSLWRPATAGETVVSWAEALRHEGPSVLSLTRQKLPPADSPNGADAVRGGYVFRDEEDFDAILLASGSELHLALALADSLDGQRIRVVSMPNRGRFLAQDAAWRDAVLPPSCKQRIAIEAGRCGQWRNLIGDAGLFIGVESFGHSAPADDVVRACGLDLASALERVQRHLSA